VNTSILWIGVVSGCFGVVDHYKDGEKHNYYVISKDERTHIAMTLDKELKEDKICTHIAVECHRVNTNLGMEDFCMRRKDK